MILITAQMFAWSCLITHNLHRAEKAMAALGPQGKLVVLNTDFEEYRDYYRDYPKTMKEVQESNVYNEYSKRPLYGPISAMLSLMLSGLLGIGFPTNMSVILSLYPTVATMLFFVLLKRSNVATPTAVWLTILSTFSFAWLAVFSVPESYSLSVCGAVAAMISGDLLRRADAGELRAAGIRHAVVAGVAAWLYMPISGAALLLLPKVKARRQWLTQVMPVTLIAIGVTMVPQLWGGTIGEQLAYGRKWASLEHFASIENWRDVVATFLFFGVVSPVKDFVYAKAEPDWVYILTSKEVLTGCGALLVVYLAVATRLASAELRRRVAGAGGWLGSMMVFHIWFSPREVLLYAAVPTVVSLYIVGLLLGGEGAGVGVGFGGKWLWVVFLTVATALVVAVNLRSVVGG